MPEHRAAGDLTVALAQNPEPETVVVPVLEIAAHVRRRLRRVADAAEVRHELGVSVHRADRVEVLRLQALAAQPRGHEGVEAMNREYSRHIVPGRSELKMSRTIFHELSACRSHTVTYLPLSTISVAVPV